MNNPIPSQDHCKIVTEEDGTIHGVSDRLRVTVTPGVQARMFNRNAIQKNLKQGTTDHLRWLVVQTGGVNVYVRLDNDGGTSVVISEKDIYP